MGLLGRRIRTKLDPCLKTILLGPYSKKSGDVTYVRVALILRIDRPICLTQIFPSIVVAGAVDVVNLVLRPFSGHVKPDEAVGEILNIANTNSNIPPIVNIVGGFADTRSAARYEPSEYPCFWIVVQKFLQSALRK